MAGVVALGYRLDGDVVLGGADRFVVGDHLLQRFAIHHELLVAGAEAAFEPARRVVDHVGATGGTSPQREGAFPGCLGVGAIGGASIGGAQRQVIMPRHLPGHLGRTHVFRGAKGWRTGLHVDIRGERTHHYRRAGIYLLQQHDSGQCLGRLLGDCACEGHRRHGARQGEGGYADHLATPGHPHGAVQHWPIVDQRAGGVDVGVHPRFGVEFRVAEAAGDTHHLHRVFDPLGAEAVAVHHLVGQDQLVAEAVEMANRWVNVHWFNWIAAHHVDAVEILAEFHQVAKAFPRAGTAAPVEVGAVGRAGDVDIDLIATANRQGAVGISWRYGEFRRGLGGHLAHQGTVEADPVRIRIDIGARRLQILLGFLVEEVDADFLEDTHGAIINRGEAFGGERLGGIVEKLRYLPGKLLDRNAGVAPGVAGPATAALAPSFAACHLVHGIPAVFMAWFSLVHGERYPPPDAIAVGMRQMMSYLGQTAFPGRVFDR